jgi:hypothetical protein
MRTSSALAIDELQVSDVTGHKSKNVSLSNIPSDYTVGELVRELLSELQFPKNDAAGRPLQYQARLDREGRHLHGSEAVGDALQSGDKVVLTPNIDAGGRSN